MQNIGYLKLKRASEFKPGIGACRGSRLDLLANKIKAIPCATSPPAREEYVEESMRADAEADMSFDEKGCPAQEARREQLTGTDCTHFSPLERFGGLFLAARTGSEIVD